jgi:excisionase family DNA binding protein
MQLQSNTLPISRRCFLCPPAPRRQRNERQESSKQDDRRGYRIAEAAAYMGVTPWFVELKIRPGELRALRMCRHYTILKEDMDAFLDEQWAAA